MASIPNPDLVQTNIANTFTAANTFNAGTTFNAATTFNAKSTYTAISPGISVGTAFTTGETDIFGGQLTLADTPDGSHVPTLSFYSWAGGAVGNNGWQLGVDTHNHGGGKDFFIGKVVNGATTDLFYFNYTSGAMGLGAATPPTDAYYLDILSTTNDTLGCLTLGVGSGATGRPLDIFNSAGVDQLWIDSAFAFNSVAGGGGVIFAGEATNNQCMTLTNNTKTLQYKFGVHPGSNVFEFDYATGGVTIYFADTSGGMQFFHNIGFYGTSPVSQANTTGTTAGFTAGAGTTVVSGSTFTGNTGATAYTIGDVVNALKRVGLMAA